MPRILEDTHGRHPVMRQWDLPGVRLTHATYAPLQRMSPHVDGRTRMSLVVAGCVEEISDEGTHLATPGSVVLKPSDVVHANRFGPSGAGLVIVEPEEGFLEEMTGGPLGLGSYHWRHGAPSALRDSLGRLLQAPTTRRTTAVRNCMGDFLSFVAPIDGGAAPPPPWLDAARRALHSRARQPPRVGALAAEADVHPVYFARAFRHHFRCTTGEYVRRVRVLNAAELLATSQAPLAEIALHVGFADQAHFSHAFRRETGTTPNAYRIARSSP